jgi:hypothetical protein
MRVGFRPVNVNRSTTSTFSALAKSSSRATDGAIDPALDEADKLHRVVERPGKLHLRQPPILAQVGDPLAEFLLKHGAWNTMSGKRRQRSLTTAQRGLVFVVWFCGFLTALEIIQQGEPGQ